MISDRTIVTMAYYTMYQMVSFPITMNEH